jgi:NAD(P)-dependent dehydrogenase (short-subunit alcohol dehydrogenase family)
MFRPYLGSSYASALELLPCFLLGAVLVNTAAWWVRLPIDVNNALCGVFDAGLAVPKWSGVEAVSQPDASPKLVYPMFTSGNDPRRRWREKLFRVEVALPSPKEGRAMAVQETRVAVPDVSSKGIMELISLKGKKAVVTGGARGIGYAIVNRFAEAGADVVVADIDEPVAKQSAATVATAWEKRIVAASADMTDGPSVEHLAELAYNTLGAIDIWVNNAGIYPSKPLLQMSDSDWDKVLDINLRGTFIGAREAARRMISAGKGGVIINLASTAGFRAAGAGVAHYVASKHGVRGLTRALAVELGPYGIRVLALAPTLISTPGIDELRKQAAAAMPGMTDLLEQMAAREPLGRAGVPDDVARVALFCASDMAMLMTGSTIPVDAGELAQ